MRIMFKRPAQFPLHDGTLTKVYEPDVEHIILDDVFEQIEGTLLYRQLRSSRNVVVINETAPTKGDVEKQQKAAEAAAAKRETKEAEKKAKEEAEAARLEEERQRREAEAATKAKEAEDEGGDDEGDDEDGEGDGDSEQDESNATDAESEPEPEAPKQTAKKASTKKDK